MLLFYHVKTCLNIPWYTLLPYRELSVQKDVNGCKCIMHMLFNAFSYILNICMRYTIASELDHNVRFRSIVPMTIWDFVFFVWSFWVVCPCKMKSASQRLNKLCQKVVESRRCMVEDFVCKRIFENFLNGLLYSIQQCY